MDPFRFQVEARAGRARVGRLFTPHGAVETPLFMPVGTAGSVKGLMPKDLEAIGSQVLLTNTYHLLLRPGPERVRALGGLHGFAGWKGPWLTDSGGFQVMSLGHMRRIDEEGVVFQSHLDGRLIKLTPERSIAVQEALGADLIMAFDECPPYPCSREAVQAATERTGRWLKRCIVAHQRPDQALFGIVQGGIYPDWRRRAAQELAELDLPGYAIGGVSVGEPPELIETIVKATAPCLPEDKPRYLMGVGTYREMAQAIAAGVDLFDCVIPTRLARHGAALVAGERWNLKNQRFRRDYTPLDATCPCYTCQNFTRAYLCHLIHAKEMLAFTLISIHNITELVRFTQRIRAAIRADRFAEEFAFWLAPGAAAHTPGLLPPGRPMPHSSPAAND